MPWTDKQSALFHAVAGGATPKKGSLSQSKAKELLSHEKGESQKKALRSDGMKGY